VVDDRFFVLRPTRVGEPAIGSFFVGEGLGIGDRGLLRVEVSDVKRASGVSVLESLLVLEADLRFARRDADAIQ
jgi:hypothetical protein